MQDRTNQTKETVSVRRQKSGPVPMGLPRSDSGKIVKAVGVRSNASAANFADAMDFVGGKAIDNRSLEQGNK